jgi:hypothetical protein
MLPQLFHTRRLALDGDQFPDLTGIKPPPIRIATRDLFRTHALRSAPIVISLQYRSRPMNIRRALSLFAAALAVLPAIAHAADGVRWESLHVYTLPDGRAVAVAVPAEWQEVARQPVLRSALRFIDPRNAEVSIPVAALERAAAEKRVFRPEPAQRVALVARTGK